MAARTTRSGQDREPHVAAGHRAVTRDMIKLAAHQEMCAHGPAGVAMRAVARRVGMPPSSLYRFFTDHADLMGSLRVDSSTHLISQLAIARSSADPADHRQQWLALARSFRHWALMNPDRFGLLFNRPVSGDPSWDEAVQAQCAGVVSLVCAVIDNAISAGDLVPPLAGTGDSRAPATTWTSPDGESFRTVALHIVLGAWAALVGYISFEPSCNLLIDGIETHFQDYLDGVTRGMGFGDLPARRGPGNARPAVAP